MKLLALPEENFSKYSIFGLILLAYLFSIAIRMIWIYQFQDMQSFHYNGQLMINTNDGYFFASSVQQALEGTHTENLRVANWLDYGVAFFTTIVVKFTPFSLETVTLYMPAFIASLVVIPMILLGALYKAPLYGFFATLIGSIAWSYYNRTMVGYYDTDMFAAMAPMFILYFLINSIHESSLKSALYASLAIIIYPFLYDQGRAVIYAMAVIYFVYLVVFHKNDENTYKSIIIISLATLPVGLYLMSPLSYLVKMLIVIGVYFLMRNTHFSLKRYVVLAIASIVLFLYFGNVFSLILSKVVGYLDRGVEDLGLHFFQVNQTVREAGKIPFSTMANRISGSSLGVIISLIGYILLVVRYRPFILALPLIGIGVFSLVGGLRFTVYAVPIAAMSAVYLFYVIANASDKKPFRYGVIMVLTALMIYPNIKHIIAYQVPTVFMADEVKVLETLNAKSSDKDYTLAWWDYGYPLWYYSDTNTLIDGGKHGHDNFIISKIMNTASQVQAANLARLSVEEYVKDGEIVADKLFKDHKPNALLEELESDAFVLPKKTRDIFLYLPNRMLDIFPTVGLFSNLDLETGIKGQQPFYYKSQRFKDDGKFVNFGSGIVLEKNNSMLHIGQNKTQLKRFTIVGYTQDGKLDKKVQTINPNSSISIIYMTSYNSFLIVDEAMYNSLFIQLFVLEEYDKSLFEPVVMSPYAKVYKLKK